MPSYLTLVSTHFDAPRATFDALVGELMSDPVSRLDHAALEELVDARGRELLRQLLQAHLSLRAEREEREEVEGADGVARTHKKVSSRKLGSLFGVVDVVRIALTARGAAGGLRPMDAELNLPVGRYSFGVGRRAAELAACVSYDTVVGELHKTTGAKVHKRQVEELVIRAATDFEAFYAHQPLVEEVTEDLLVLSFDGKGIVMRPEGLRPATRKAAEKTKSKLGRRRSPGEKPRKRMAEVATVYDIAKHPRSAAQVLGTEQRSQAPRPANKRVWASVVEGASEVIWQGFVEATRRDPALERRWVALVDGNAHQLQQIEAHATDLGAEVTVVVDFIHVTEYLWKAAWSLYDKGDSAAERWVEGHIQRILGGRSHLVVQSLRQVITKRGLKGTKRKALDTAANYLHKHRLYLRYDEYLREGLPIATGVIEGACRHLVKDRMDITGARWGLSGAEAVLRLRALKSSGDLERYWGFHHRRELERNHLNNYAANEMTELRRAA
jgi:hypothetical protein